MSDIRWKSHSHGRVLVLAVSALIVLTVLSTTRTQYASTPISALNDEKRGKSYICNGDPQPPGYGIVAVATGFGNPSNLCGAAGTTFYIEKFSDGLVVCGTDLSLPGYLLLYPIDYVVTAVANRPQCPSSVGWQIAKLKGENTVCRLNNVIGTQLVVPSGYVVTGLTDSAFDSCPGPVVTIKQPGKTEVVCGYSQAVLANAFYVLPPGYIIVGTTNSATCPSDPGTLLNAWTIERVGNPNKVGINELVTLMVSGQANIFGANGADPTPEPAGGGGGVAASFISFSSSSNLVLTFSSITGTVSCCDPGNIFLSAGPDGNSFLGTDLNSYQGISGIRFGDRSMFLVGVFTDGSDPSGQIAPATLTYNTGPGSLSAGASAYAPALRQIFFIGDGLTGTGTGSVQQFHVPTGATHLYLGFADGSSFFGDPGFYGDNGGSINANFAIRQFK